MFIPKKREGKIAAALFILGYLMMAPPFVWVADTPELFLGFPTLWLWVVLWASVLTVALLYAVKTNAWAITEENVPPELKDKTATVGFFDTDRKEAPASEVSD